ncbi:TlpA family protein disulfide reductase [Pedobacter nyackensis]|uniref:Thiol-disulfide isomerase or thioredoxin n=1 Tax=Pedobacter nyackensis TaxID=475255 RepID=A0A1W2AK98_9SPHI|nr:TlpA disulfide reductase family protein [Pedobacter nyackensis]SMC61117.1 Thiol-disulfide isomerase or thioredoxin [Pedobacter nyackensis]
MKKLLATVVLLNLGISLSLFGQQTPNIQILLSYNFTEKSNFSPVLYKKIEEARDEFILPTGFKEGLIKQVDIQQEQGFFEMYLQKKERIGKDNLVKGLKYFNVDSLDLSRTPTHHLLFVLIGLNREGIVEARFDSNFNCDFSDDRAYIFNAKKENLIEQAHIQDFEKVVLQYVSKGKIYNKPFYIKPITHFKSYSYSNPIEQKYFLMIEQLGSLSGILKTETSTTKLKVQLSSIFEYSDQKTQLFIDDRSLDRTNKNSYYNILDTIKIAGSVLVFSGISTSFDTLYFRHIEQRAKQYSTYGVNTGTIVKNFAKTDLYGKSFNLEALKGKYVLLDFWGSWCNPCIAAIPEIKKIHQKYKHKLEVVNIAFDRDEALVKDLVKKHEMSWTHLFDLDNRENKHSLIKLFKVTTFPTQILIDPAGKILFRGVGDNVNKIINLIELNNK